MHRLRVMIAVAFALTLLGGCGDSNPDDKRPVFGRPDPGDARERAAEAAEVPGPPASATRNTTRIAGSTTPDLAAAVVRAAFPGKDDDERPRAVTLVDDGAWWAGLPAAQLMAPPLRAPLLVGGPKRLPVATRDALAALDPTGSPELDDRAQVIRVGTDGPAGGRPTQDVAGGDAFATAAAIDRLHTRVAGRPSGAVLLAPIEQPAVAMAAAGWAARSGDALLWTHRDGLPPATREAIRSRMSWADAGRDPPRPDLYVLGSPDLIRSPVVRELAGLGRVTRIDGDDPTEVSVALARFRQRDVGWGAVGPGHGIVLMTRRHPLTGGAAAALSASAGAGPPLVLEDGQDDVADPIREYLLDIRPSTTTSARPPATPGLYNRAWLIGDEDAISLDAQAAVDSLLEAHPDDEP